LYIKVSPTSYSGSIGNFIETYAISTASAGRYLMSSYNTSNDAGWELSIKDGNLCAYIDDGGGFPSSPDDSACTAWSSSTASQWKHVALTKSSSELKLYVDGSLVDTDSSLAATGSLSGGTLQTILGGGVGGTTDYITSTFDNVRFYDRELSASEISELYERGL